MASILKSNVKGIPALFGLDPVSNFLGLTVNHMTVLLDEAPGAVWTPQRRQEVAVPE